MKVEIERVSNGFVLKRQVSFRSHRPPWREEVIVSRTFLDLMRYLANLWGTLDDRESLNLSGKD